MTFHDETVDVLGIGFGPSNMALAIALEEYNSRAHDEDKINAIFFEKQESSAWHPHMLFEDASMQVAFAKDLVTFRNPQSKYSFLSFLVAHDRIVDFFNRGSMLPLRTEFSHYLQWAAQQLNHFVSYASTVTKIEPTYSAHSTVNGYQVTVQNQGKTRIYYAQHVVLAAGVQPVYPTQVQPTEHVWHTADFLKNIKEISAPATQEFAVVGGGQSAAEAVIYLHNAYPEARIHCIHSAYGYIASDMTPYANKIFDPEAVNDFFYAPEEKRLALLDKHISTNYSCVNADTIEQIFEMEYVDRCVGRTRLIWHKASSVREIREENGRVHVDVLNHLTDQENTITVDVAVCGTGYKAFDASALLGDHSWLVQRDRDGKPHINRDYSAVLTVSGDAKLFLIGQTHHTHGMSSTLLSNIAVRAGEIVDSLLAHRTAHQQAQDILEVAQ
ncbi:lysine N(6)-hydroxylase/L-ornithine N(5)-oxygenase family protein [Timonella sp. A28]|uniref:lysine N(6)-hydroxylase/L-ornithine N(5)-oxygenase family protein n=1 Tax=Timonella sp. A28 TaxID=3442640 RepID=UPI003EB9143E